MHPGFLCRYSCYHSILGNNRDMSFDRWPFLSENPAETFRSLFWIVECFLRFVRITKLKLTNFYHFKHYGNLSFSSWVYQPTLSLEDCLGDYFSQAELNGDNKYSCERCKRWVPFYLSCLRTLSKIWLSLFDYLSFAFWFLVIFSLLKNLIILFSVLRLHRTLTKF